MGHTSYWMSSDRRSQKDSIPGQIPAENRHELYALVQLLTSGPTYLYLVDKGGYDSDRAADIASRAIAALIDDATTAADTGQ